MRATPVTGTVRAGLREYHATGEPATLDGAFSVVLAPTADAAGIDVTISGDMRGTSLAPRPAPLVGSANGFPWLPLAVLAAVAVVAGGGAVALRRHYKNDAKTPALAALLDLGRLALEGAQKPNGSSDYAPALQHYTDATQLAPDSEEAWMGLGYAHHYAGNGTEALKAFSRAYALGGSPDALLMVAISLGEVGDGDGASDWLLKALQAPDIDMDDLTKVKENPRLRAAVESDPALKAAFQAATERALAGFGRQPDDSGESR